MDATLKELEEERAGVASLARPDRQPHDLSPGARFRAALAAEKPLQVPGAINAYHAHPRREVAAIKALYLSGGGVAAGSLGLPDLGIRTLDDVLTDVRRITDASDAAAAGRRRHRLRRVAPSTSRAPCKLADQGRRGGDAHRGPGRRQALRPPPGQGAGVAARRWSTASRPPSTRAPIRTSSSWRAPTRSPSKASTPRSTAPCACVEAGADMIFPEAITDLAMYRQLRRRGGRADPRQHHRVRHDAALHRRRAARAPASPSRSTRCRRSAR